MQVKIIDPETKPKPEKKKKPFNPALIPPAQPIVNLWFSMDGL